MKATYTTTISKDDEKNATGIPVPAEVVATFGVGKRPPVVVHIGGHRYRSTVAAYGDVYMLPLSQEHRAAAGVEAGQSVEITLELDEQPRTVDVPDCLLYTSGFSAVPRSVAAGSSAAGSSAAGSSAAGSSAAGSTVAAVSVPPPPQAATARASMSMSTTNRDNLRTFILSSTL